MRTKYYFVNPSLESLSYASFTQLNETHVYLIGGMDLESPGLFGEDGQPPVPTQHQTLIIEVPIYQKQFRLLTSKSEDNQLNLKITRGPKTLQPRQRHACVSDGVRFIYLLGSQYPKAANEVERYDSMSKTWMSLPSLIKGGKNLSCCHFNGGSHQGQTLWCLAVGETLQRLKIVDGSAGANIWEEIPIRESEAGLSDSL